jgi:hypothetical protein
LLLSLSFDFFFVVLYFVFVWFVLVGNLNHTPAAMDDDYLDDFLGDSYGGPILDDADLDDTADALNDETFGGEQLPGNMLPHYLAPQSAHPHTNSLGLGEEEDEDFDLLAQEISSATNASLGDIEETWDPRAVLSVAQIYQRQHAKPAAAPGRRGMTDAEVDLVLRNLMPPASAAPWDDDYYVYAHCMKRRIPLPPTPTPTPTPNPNPNSPANPNPNPTPNPERMLGKMAPFSLRRPRVVIDVDGMVAPHKAAASNPKAVTARAMEACYGVLHSLEAELAQQGGNVAPQRRKELLKQLTAIFGCSVTILADMSQTRKGVLLLCRVLRLLTPHPEDAFMLRPLLVHMFYYAPLLGATTAATLTTQGELGWLDFRFVLRVVAEKVAYVPAELVAEILGLVLQRRVRHVVRGAQFAELLRYATPAEFVLPMLAMLVDAGARSASAACVELVLGLVEVLQPDVDKYLLGLPTVVPAWWEFLAALAGAVPQSARGSVMVMVQHAVARYRDRPECQMFVARCQPQVQAQVQQS